MAYKGRSSGNFRRKKDFGPRKNQYIRVPEVLVIDNKGEKLGVMKTDDAVARARELDLDLVEVGATAEPPVCKIMDYSKYVYEQNKKKRKSRAITRELKEFRFSPVIDVGDREWKIKRAKDFLSKGHNVKVTVFRKGRQTREQAMAVFQELLTNFEDYSTIDPDPTKQGRYISITYKADGKAKNKQNSEKKNKDVKPKGQKKAKDSVQAKLPRPSKDKKVKKS